MTSVLVVHVLLLIVLLGGSFFFSSSETALFSLAARHFTGMEDDDRAGQRVRRLLAQPYRLLVLLLLGNNIVNIAAVAVSHRLVEIGAAHWGLTALGTMVLSITVGTGLLLLAGEIAPKTFALQMPLQVARRTARTLVGLSRVLGPLVTGFTAATNRVLVALGMEGPMVAAVSEEELLTIVSVSEEEGVLAEDEREMIGRVFELGDTLVREVFVPRPDVVRVPIDATVATVLAASARFGHARLPVIGETVDDVLGICHVKDLIPYVRSGRLDQPIAGMLRPAHIVPDTKRVDDCLREFRRQRIHMAVVVDEYGGTAGIVTLEDLVEEIVGEIFDEHDDLEAPVIRVQEGQWRVEGSMPLSDLAEQWGAATLPNTEYDTLGGLVLELFGRFPYPGESVKREGITYTVEKVGRNRLERILVEFGADAPAVAGGNGTGQQAGAAPGGAL